MEKRSVYTKRLASSIREWDAVIDGLRLQRETASPGKAAVLRRSMVELINKRDEGLRLLDMLREADEAELPEVERQAERLMDLVASQKAA